jgi:hypothetical protein
VTAGIGIFGLIYKFLFSVFISKISLHPIFSFQKQVLKVTAGIGIFGLI